MPPRPFPYPIHIGIDICHIPRIAKIICAESLGGILIPNRDKLYRFTRKLFTPYEQQLLRKRFPGFHDEIASLNEANATQWRPKLLKLSEYLAGRWAAKEAAIKALRPERRTLGDIMILAEESGLPYALIQDKQRPRERDIQLGDREDRNAIADGLPLLNKDGASDSAMEHGMQQSDLLNLDQLEGQAARLSISHDGDFVTAVCMAVQDPVMGDIK